MKVLLPIFCFVLGVTAAFGQVGIGTDSPQARLHLHNSIANQENRLLIESQGAATISLDAPSNWTKSLKFLSNGVVKSVIGQFNDQLKIYTDTSGSLSGPTMVITPGRNVGINQGIFGSPTYRLDVNGKIRIGNDLFFPAAGVLRFNSTSNRFEGHDGTSWSPLTSLWNTTGNNLHYDDGPVLIGRSNTIGSERFGIRAPVVSAAYGGMYMETNGHMDSKPFYGYAINNSAKMWHYYDGADAKWKMVIGGSNRLAVTSTGDFGLGTLDPIARMHVHGTEGDVYSADGILAIGTETQRLVIAVETDGPSAGVARIAAKGSEDIVKIGGRSHDVLTVHGDFERVGVNIDPVATLDVMGDNEQTAFQVINPYNGSFTKEAGYFEVTDEGDGQRHAIHARAYGRNSTFETDNVYSGRFFADGNAGSGNVYGLYSQVTADGTGNHYGLYATAGTADPSPSTRSWAVYANGNSYFSSNVHIGTQDGSTGYRLAVDGKIVAEEVKVQMSGAWPDYVFENSYDLMSLQETDQFIRKHKHLPGVPSAAEVSADAGIHVGEMHRILLEKIEELTLHIIEQDKRMHAYEEQVEQLRKDH